jgi:DedD protein
MNQFVRPSAIPRPSLPAHPPVSASQYTVQAGAFLHASNAEKLLQQLQSAGIPAYLETRVQIGPFTNKAEADAAMAKLRKMGINPVLNAAR